MKKLLTIFLLAAVIIGAAACGNNEEPTSMGIVSPGIETPDPQLTESQTPGTGLSIDVSPDPSASISPAPGTNDPNAPTLSPGVTPTLSPGVSPSPSATPGEKLTYSKAKEINKEVVGWISVPNTKIDYPILHDKSGKFFYDNHDVYKNASSAGSIYTYYSTQARNNVITGHNMRESNTMFHPLHAVQDSKSKLATRDNRIFKIRFGDFREWEVFAMYETSKSEPMSTLTYNTKHLTKKDDPNTAAVQEWIDYQLGRSELKGIVDVKVSTSDVFITLVTCGDGYDSADAQSRLYFFLKGIQPAA